jgi:hypothetical protein
MIARLEPPGNSVAWLAQPTSSTHRSPSWRGIVEQESSRQILMTFGDLIGDLKSLPSEGSH